jgi:CheY-like chemotaxis protein
MKDTHKIFELKILLAEDDEIAAKLLTLLVKEYGKIVLSAKNGVEAVAIARNNPDIDLILMDPQMPK